MANLQINERNDGEFAVLDLKGDVIFGDSNTMLRTSVRKLLAENKIKIAINLNDVDYLDSSGIGELISALTAVNRHEEGHLRILNPGVRIQKLFEVAKLTPIFDIGFDASGATAN